MSNIKKNQDPERWLLRKRNGQGPSAETAALFKAERSGSTGPIPSASLGPGGRRLKTVDNGMNGLFGDDEDEDEDGEGRKRRTKRELGAEGDVDEMDFEEQFADDEEKMEPDDRDDEEAKELEVIHNGNQSLSLCLYAIIRNGSRRSTRMQTRLGRDMWMSLRTRTSRLLLVQARVCARPCRNSRRMVDTMRAMTMRTLTRVRYVRIRQLM